MKKSAERKNRFFVHLFILSFAVCELVLGGNYLYKHLEDALWMKNVVAAVGQQTDHNKESKNEEISEDKLEEGEAESKPADKSADQTGERKAGSKSADKSADQTEEGTAGSKSADQTEEGKAESKPEENIAERSEAGEEEKQGESKPENKSEESAEESAEESPENRVREAEQEQTGDGQDEVTMDSSQQEKQFVTVDYTYFDDALFIGDSRTVGLMEYGNLGNAAFFADSGMSVFDLEREKVFQPDGSKVSFEKILSDKVYGKIYLMLGINEIGYKFETFENKYEEIIDYIREYQGEAVLFLCANMHVTEAQSKKDALFNNTNVNRVNEMIAGLTDSKTSFYIDVNEVFDDGKGNLAAEYSSDAFHVYGRHYKTWADWLCTKGIQK